MFPFPLGILKGLRELDGNCKSCLLSVNTLVNWGEADSESDSGIAGFMLRTVPVLWKVPVPVPVPVPKSHVELMGGFRGLDCNIRRKKLLSNTTQVFAPN